MIVTVEAPAVRKQPPKLGLRIGVIAKQRRQPCKMVTSGKSQGRVIAQNMPRILEQVAVHLLSFRVAPLEFSDLGEILTRL